MNWRDACVTAHLSLERNIEACQGVACQRWAESLYTSISMTCQIKTPGLIGAVLAFSTADSKFMVWNTHMEVRTGCEAALDVIEAVCSV